MPMELTPMLTVSPSDTPLVKTPSPRDSSPRGLLMLTLLSSMQAMDTPTPMPMFLSDPALDLTPSPRDLTLPPRDMSPTMDTDTMVTTARGLLMLRLTPPSSSELTAMLMISRSLLTPLTLLTLTPSPAIPMPMLLSDPALDLTPPPRDLTLPPRDMSPTMDTD